MHEAGHSAAFAVAVPAVAHVIKMPLLVCKKIPHSDYTFMGFYVHYISKYTRCFVLTARPTHSA